MALFTNKNFINHDDYMTPKYVWQDIKDLIPPNTVIWECFYGDGTSGENLKELGFDVIHEKIDFFNSDRGELLVSNPPFSKKKEVFTRLKQLNKPFIMLAPSSMINTQYIRQLFSNCDDKIQIIIPKKRINFTKKKDNVSEKLKNTCNFDCFYYCWKINLPNDINWL